MFKKKDELIISGKKFASRLIMGTSLYPNLEVMNKSLEASGTEIITVSMRRFNKEGEKFFLKGIKNKYTFLPNTAGCFTKKEALLTAELSRESLKTDWIKLELISENEMLLPDPLELFDTCEELVKKKFKIFAYCSDDPILCKRLEELGCAAVMPLGAPIGSGQGLTTKEMIQIIITIIVHIKL